MTGPTTTSMSPEHEQASSRIELIIAWLWVGIPAVWGIWHVFLTSLKLFQ